MANTAIENINSLMAEPCGKGIYGDTLTAAGPLELDTVNDAIDIWKGGNRSSHDFGPNAFTSLFYSRNEKMLSHQ